MASRAVIGKLARRATVPECQLSKNDLAFVECNGTGKPIGAECHFEERECATDICVNGTCVECALNSDCQDGQICTGNMCQ